MTKYIFLVNALCGSKFEGRLLAIHILSSLDTLIGALPAFCSSSKLLKSINKLQAKVEISPAFFVMLLTASFSLIIITHASRARYLLRGKSALTAGKAKLPKKEVGNRCITSSYQLEY
jgi:hypothetical protein